MDKPLLPRPERSSYVKHRRERTFQILLPILLAALIGLGFAALAIYGAAGHHTEVSLWADISLIWLIIPMLFLALIILALVITTVYGLTKLLGAAPHYTGLVQHYALRINTQIVQWTEKITHPMLSLKAWLGIFSKHEADHDPQRRNRTEKK